MRQLHVIVSRPSVLRDRTAHLDYCNTAYLIGVLYYHLCRLKSVMDAAADPLISAHGADTNVSRHVSNLLSCGWDLSL